MDTSVELAPPFPVSVLADSAHWARVLGDEWLRDLTGATPAGSPGWYEQIQGWTEGSGRSRATHAMRKLRRSCPREYEVLYRAMVEQERFNEIATWLNDRAIRNHIPLLTGRASHYSEKDATALFLAAVEYLRSVY